MDTPTPDLRTTRDLTTLRMAAAQASASMMLPAYAREAIAASHRVIETQQLAIAALQADMAKLKGGR